MSSAKIKNLDMTAKRRLESRLAPGPITKFFNAINPMSSLGKIAGKNFNENSLTISLILIFCLAIGIISTVMFVEMDNFTNEKYMVAAVMSLSWFVFTNFTFLVFEGTRLFNILLFITLVTLSGIVVSNLDQNSVEARLGISVIALATVPLTILAYYYLASEGDEVVQLKTLEREKKNKQDIKEILAKYKKDVKEEVKKELTEDITSKEGIKGRIANAYIDALVDSAKKNVGGGGKKDDGKKKKEDDKKKEEKDNE